MMTTVAAVGVSLDNLCCVFFFFFHSTKLIMNGNDTKSIMNTSRVKELHLEIATFRSFFVRWTKSTNNPSKPRKPIKLQKSLKRDGSCLGKNALLHAVEVTIIIICIRFSLIWMSGQKEIGGKASSAPLHSSSLPLGVLLFDYFSLWPLHPVTPSHQPACFRATKGQQRRSAAYYKE